MFNFKEILKFTIFEDLLEDKELNEITQEDNEEDDELDIDKE